MPDHRGRAAAGLITDARAGQIAALRPGWISPDAGQVRLLSGTYRIPEVARPLLRAALLDHQDVRTRGGGRGVPRPVVGRAPPRPPRHRPGVELPPTLPPPMSELHHGPGSGGPDLLPDVEDGMEGDTESGGER